MIVCENVSLSANVCLCVKERVRERDFEIGIVFLSFLKSVAIILHFQPPRHATRSVSTLPMQFFTVQIFSHDGF